MGWVKNLNQNFTYWWTLGALGKIRVDEFGYVPLMESKNS